MNKLVSKILISVIMVAIFMAPISAGIKINKVGHLTLKTETNISIAQGALGENGGGPTTITPTTQAEDQSYFNCSWSALTCHVASFMYYFLFVPLSTFTYLSAKILDFFVYYSTNSSSYSGDFVAKSWAAVRDVANILFIITLLYIAIKTILGLNVTNNKKLISAVIMVALIINFSLFVTRVVIDSSNVLAKVFYNNITSVDETGKPLPPEKGGQKSISVGLVKQFNPQEIFGPSFKDHQGLFIFVTILSILLMAFMMYIFLSVALLFVSRVVSLWLSMISSPIAFISFAVPFKIPGFGWGEWSDNLFKNAMLAPLFIFFLYIIILFGDAIKNVPYDVSLTANDVGGYLDSSMRTIIPFIFIFFLLQKAKELAVSYSGDMGKAIQSIVGTTGALALGGAAVGGAALGRNLIGKSAAKMSENAYHQEKATTSWNEKLDKWEKGGKVGAKPTWEQHKAEYIRGGGKDFNEGMLSKLGAIINANQKHVEELAHGRHEMDAAKEKAGFKGVDDSRLSSIEKQKIEKEFIKSKKSEIESEIKNGLDSKGNEMKDAKGDKIMGQNEYKSSKRQDFIDKIKATNDPKDVKDDGELTDQGKKKVEDQLNTEFGIYLKDRTAEVGKERFEHVKKEAETKVGIGERLSARSTSGSYDIRNIPTKLDKREAGLGSRATLGLIAAVSMGMKNGLKTTLNVKDIGTSQRDFTKDMGNLITSALKGASINIKLGDGGGGGGHDAHGGGHDAGHGDAHGSGGHH